MEENTQTLENTITAETPKKSKTGIIIAVVILIAVAAATYFVFGNKKGATQVQQTTQTAPSKNYTLAEVASHSVKGDCWLLIDGNVYDISAFIPKHPGEDQILLGCGKDATELFATKAGQGIPHSSKALNMREEFKIGILSGT